MRVKLKNIHSGAIIERTFKSGERFKNIILERRRVQYLYTDGSIFHFIDMGNYEQIELETEMLGENVHYLKENVEVYISSIEGSIIGIDLPVMVDLRVTYTEQGVKGDTVSRVMKPAKLETGAEVKVPLFVNVDDIIKIDTRTGEYVERVT